MRAVLLSLVLCGFTLLISQQFSPRTVTAQDVPKMKLGEPLPANIFIELAKIMNPTVVNISTTTLPRQGSFGGQFRQDPFMDLFEQFMGPQRMRPQQPQQALGTGFIIRSNGLILTNNHVVENASVIKVQLSEKDSVMYTATLIGRDKRSDLALIRIDAKRQLPFARLGTSRDLQVGEWVAAFGNPLGLGHTTSKGIISAIGRKIGELNRFPFLQTDASINPGNSGGPLVNMRGEVIGVNSAIAANSQGIGFAIPIDDAKSIIAALEKDGVIHHGYLGVNMYPYPIDPQAARELKLNRTNGTLVVGVLPGSPAAKAGLRERDFITKFDGQSADDPSSLSSMIADAQVGKSYAVEFLRNGKTQKVDVILEERPEDKNEVQARTKSYNGQRAPYDLGFTVTNYSEDLARNFGLPGLRQPLPVVIDVEPDSPAAKSGLALGDIVVDVNGREVRVDRDVLKALKDRQMNTLRVLRGQYTALININPR